MSALTSLAPELLLQIFAALDLRGRIRLSSTCSRLRNFGVNEVRVFETLSFAWSKQHVADSALLVAQTYGDMVRTLRVVHSAPLCFYPAEEDMHKCHCDEPGSELPTLPPSSITLLHGRGSDGPLLPCVDSLVIEFPATYPDGKEHPYGEIDYEVLELYSDDCFDDRHPIKCNNAHIDAMLQYLVDSNYIKLPVIKSLRIVNLPPHSSVFFDSTNWRRFLGGLNHLDLCLYGWGGDHLTNINKQACYLDFVDGIDRMILNHLTGLTKLGFHVTDHAPLEELPWKPTALPLLKELELTNVDVNAHLLSFLKSWSKVVNRPLSLTLTNAAADSQLVWGYPEYLTWEAFFDCLMADNVGFSKFEVTMREVDMTDASADFTNRLVANPHLLVFSYGQLDDKYRDWMDSPEMTTERFLLGRDQASYEKFMAKVGNKQT
ncbi:hypothetical protein MCOR25_010168 [Pyricularia grisea]|uniref:F-box domain-containing protein n=1 Tax=Pyricularia grisea TaxID=148305 RepID=A0A6P8ANQ9_PYRGI|nr:uncharacterized protein PgNI_11817 [Pyricularia grisea]KAI6351074.1 hypothetical protein MCOR25_010168 [Pyricularia grisea]TLD03656.1 hypothetical protein PgNI_11817 [Pyricularia grisea]